MRKSFKNMLREIKIFSLLEQYRKKQNDQSSLLKVFQVSKINDGLPELLGYKIG
jgi:serine/threonine protein kinase